MNNINEKVNFVCPKGNQIKAEPCISSIPQGIAYHQNEVLYIIIAKALYTFGDEIQGRQCRP